MRDRRVWAAASLASAVAISACSSRSGPALLRDREHTSDGIPSEASEPRAPSSVTDASTQKDAPDADVPLQMGDAEGPPRESVLGGAPSPSPSCERGAFAFDVFRFVPQGDLDDAQSFAGAWMSEAAPLENPGLVVAFADLASSPVVQVGSVSLVEAPKTFAFVGTPDVRAAEVNPNVPLEFGLTRAAPIAVPVPLSDGRVLELTLVTAVLTTESTACSSVVGEIVIALRVESLGLPFGGATRTLSDFVGTQPDLDTDGDGRADSVRVTLTARNGAAETLEIAR